MRITDELPVTATTKVLKRVLRNEGWHCSEPVWWRPERDAPFRLLLPEDAEALDRRSPSAESAADSAVDAQDQPTGRHAGADGDQHVVHLGHLVDRGAPHLAHALGDAVHPVQVGLAQLPAVGVDRQSARRARCCRQR